MSASTISFSVNSASINTARRRYRHGVEARHASHADAGGAVPASVTSGEWDKPGLRDGRGIAIIVCGALACHLAVLWYLNAHRSSDTHPLRQPAPLVVEIAPPPPPPPLPVIQPPKPLPQVLKPLHQPPRPRIAPTPRPAPATPTPPAVVNSAPAPDAVGAAPPAPAPAAPPAAAPVERITEPHGSAGYLNNPAPQYPDAAQERNWQGRVMLRVHVLADGHADAVKVAQSSGHQLLDDAAVKAVSRWLFSPAKRGETPIDGWANVPIDFKLAT